MLTFILIFGLVILTAVLFTVWAFARVVIWIVGALLGNNRKPQYAAGAWPGGSQASICARTNCRAVNAAHARFCHRCGNAIAIGRGGLTPVQMRYVA